eukprot:5879907-Amphidinium_carterae.3
MALPYCPECIADALHGKDQRVGHPGDIERSTAKRYIDCLKVDLAHDGEVHPTPSQVSSTSQPHAVWKRGSAIRAPLKGRTREKDNRLHHRVYSGGPSPMIEKSNYGDPIVPKIVKL